MVHETRKIMGDESIRVSPTTARVPVATATPRRSTSSSTARSRVDQAREALLRRPPASCSMDDYAAGKVPQPLHAVGRDEVFVGRIRRDPPCHGLNMWVVADNLRKGAATNAVQIAEELLRLGIVKS